jgi:hypothetical protein
MSGPVDNVQLSVPVNVDNVQFNNNHSQFAFENKKESSWVGRAIKWLNTTPGGHLVQGLGGFVGAAASAMAAAAVLVISLKGVIFGAILLATIVLIPVGIIVIAASCSLATTYNYPLKAMHNCWDFAMNQFAQMKAQSLNS